MRMPFLVLALAVGLTEFSTPSRAAPMPWQITRTEWTGADEQKFGEFVRAIAESGCTTTDECMRGPANPYRVSDPEGLDFGADCAKWAYMLRAYFAWKNGLPFSYVDAVSGNGGDPRFNGQSNRPQSRRDVVDRGNGIPAAAVLKVIHDSVSTATFRMDASMSGRMFPDFYSPKIHPGSVRPGTVLYDTNGHVGIVYDVLEDGRIRYLDADPDETVTRGVYGPQFGQSPARLGGGFKNFRPLKLVDAKRREDGTYIGGRVVVAADEDIPDFSLEQYRGNVPGADGDGAGALFKYNGVRLGFFEYIRASMSGGQVAFNPVYEARTSIRSLCSALQERLTYVDIAVQTGLDKKAHPARIPSNIYQADDEEWESYATPSRDARIKSGFAQLYQDISRMVFLWYQSDPRIAYDGPSLKEGLQQAYREEADACSVTYTNSAGAPVRLSFEDIVARLFTMSFDPYLCVERRWGAMREEELATCADNAVKSRWYVAEQRLRNQAERSFLSRAPFTLADLENRVTGTGIDDPPPVDIKGVIDSIGHRWTYTTMKPVGF